MNKYVIIAGATKSGTTSLYNYLSDHPEICAANYKETRFFMNEFDDLNNSHQILNSYNDLFHCDKDKILKLEATSEYLNNLSVPERIAKILDKREFKVILILRNPIDRFISWYKFAKQEGKVRKECSLINFYEKNINNEDDSIQHLMALKHGQYSKYIVNFYESIDAENIKIVYFDDLVNNPNKLLKELSKSLKIDEAFYNDYEIKRYNKSVQYKYPKLNGYFRSIKRQIREKISIDWIILYLKKLNYIFDEFYSKVNEISEINISQKNKEEVVKILRKYYSEELKLFSSRSYEKQANLYNNDLG